MIPAFVAIKLADLIPGGPPHNAVGGEAEVFLELLHTTLSEGVKGAGDLGLAEAGVILGDAGKLFLQDIYRRSGGPPPQGGAGVALRDGGNVVGGHQLDPAAIVVPQDFQGAFAFIGPVYRAPLLHAGAAHRLAVAVFGEIGLGIPRPAHIGAEEVCRQPFHHLKDGAARDIGLVIAGRIGDVEGIAPAGVPFGVNPVEGQADLGQNVGFQGLGGPGGVDLAGGHVGDIILKAHRDIADIGGGAAQVDGDLFGDHHRTEHPRRVADAGLSRCRTAAAPAGKKRMFGNLDDGILSVGAGQGGVLGEHLHPGHRLLTVKQLDAGNRHRLPAGLFCPQGVDRIGPDGGVGLIQAIFLARGVQGQQWGFAILPSGQMGNHPALFVQDCCRHAGQRRCLLGNGGKDL